MADYYSILNKAVSGLAHNSHGTRSAIYDKARQAIDRQLRAMQPAPTEAAIAKQLQFLETAIERIEAEQTVAAADEPVAGSPAPSEPGPAEVAGAPEPKPASPTALPPEPTDAPEAAPATPEVDPPSQSPAETSEHAADPTPPAAPPVDPPQAAPPTDAGADPVLTDPRGMDYSEAMLEPQTAPKPRSGGLFATLLPILLGLALVAGGAYALWLNRDALLDGLLGTEEPVAAREEPTATSAQQSGQTGEAPTDEQPPQTETAPADDETADEPPTSDDVGAEEPSEPIIKSNTRLSSDGETTEAEPLPDEDGNAPAANVDEATGESPDETSGDGAPASPVTEVSGEGEQADADAAQPTTDTGPAVAQKAFLYEEGSTGSSASRDNAAIIWSLAQEDVAGSTEAVIRGQLDIPGRGMTMNLAIKRNADESLPASHIIELMFQVPPDFTGGAVASVARVMMKSSEQSRGESLIAVPAKIDDGFFLIALNNLEQAIATNRGLMLDSAWIDIPLGYSTGQWALVTLEKGAIGDKIFRDAFADWDNR